MLNIFDITPVNAEVVSTDEGIYTRWDTDIWCERVGKSNVPVLDYNELELAYQRFINNET